MREEEWQERINGGKKERENDVIVEKWRTALGKEWRRKERRKKLEW